MAHYVLSFAAMPPLASPTDLSRRLGVPRRTIYNWIELPDFPRHVEEAGGSRLWDEDEVRRWRDDTESDRKPGPKS
jgi:predicted DNA-binding transcriptional regulator AlpA